MKKNKRFIPKVGEKHYFIYDYGNSALGDLVIFSAKRLYEKDSAFHTNTFKTLKEATLALRKIKQILKGKI